MKKYKKLLESTIKEDVALGLFMSHRDKLLPDSPNFHNYYAINHIQVRCTRAFTVTFDDSMLWINGNTITIGPKDGYTEIENIDFRTKIEEEI